MNNLLEKSTMGSHMIPLLKLEMLGRVCDVYCIPLLKKVYGVVKENEML